MTDEFESLDALWAVAGLRASHTDSLSAIPVGVSVNGAPILAGVGMDRSRYVLFPVAGSDPVQEDITSAGVQLRERTLVFAGTSRRFAALGCTMPWLEDAFSDIAAECILRVGNKGALRPDLAVQSVLGEWRELLAAKAKEGLPEETLVGLIGELDTLCELAEIDANGALAAWTGPGGGLHDFRNGPVALEVKSSRRRHGRVLTINGVEQLLPPPDARLFLRYVRMERVPGGTVTLRGLAERLASHGITRQMLDKSLTKLGIRGSELEEYDSCAVDIVERRTYLVDQNFPRIIPTSFSGGELPQGIVSLGYTIELTQEPPYPIAEEELITMRRGLVGWA